MGVKGGWERCRGEKRGERKKRGRREGERKAPDNLILTTSNTACASMGMSFPWKPSGYATGGVSGEVKRLQASDEREKKKERREKG